MQRPTINAVSVLSDKELDQYLEKISVLVIMEQTFTALSQGQVAQPAQSLTLFPQNRGDVITYQGVLSHVDVFGAKLSPYIATDSAPIITAWTILMSMKTGQPLLICDSGRLTRERTAATTALAIDKLARKESKILALIGTGAIGLAHLKHVLALRDWQEIRIYSPDLALNQSKQTQFKALDDRISLCDSNQACIDDADVIMLCTSSGKPVIDVKQLRKPALITSISTNIAQAHEIDPALLSTLDVYCDDKKTTPHSAGEMVLAAQQHQWSADKIVGDLADLCCHQCPEPSYQKSVFFRSIGLGIEDIAIAYAIYQQI
ncbi:ornithine cyclodeaminase family protein [Utexia brackfieldae]|uniref:ornithine cyclodeaminase family protein n=1 Tax=Utexia brackfieldae TaxID=3074108 RepID=UPI00370D1252